MSNKATLWWSTAAILLTVVGAQAQSSSPLTIQPSTSRVGINTTAPAYTLDVSGTVRATAFRGDGSLLVNLPASGGPWTQTGVDIANTNSGGVGVGVATPGTRFHVKGGTTTLEHSADVAKPLRLDGGSDALTVDLEWRAQSTTRATTRVKSNGSAPGSDWSLFWHVQDPWGTSQPLMRLHGGTRALYLAGSLYTGGLPDVAENVWVSDPTIGAGDLVAIDRGEPRKHDARIYDRLTVRKSSGRYDPDVLGVISSGAGILLNTDPAALDHGKPSAAGQHPLALAGRVPVRVSLENGPIAPGDRIVASSMPGVGMRATSAGMSVGIAAESYDRSDGTDVRTILVFVNLSPTAAPRLRSHSRVGDETAARGHARLRHGEAAIELPETLARQVRARHAAVHLTPVGGWSPLYVADAPHPETVIVRTTTGGDPAQAFFWEVKTVDAEAPAVALGDLRGRR